MSEEAKGKESTAANRERAIFDAGFAACLGHGDNGIHRWGKQSGRVFNKAMERIDTFYPAEPPDLLKTCQEARAVLRLAAQDMREWLQLAKRQHDEMPENSALCPSSDGITATEVRLKKVNSAIVVINSELSKYEGEDA